MIQRNVIDWLEKSALIYPDKSAFETESEKLSYRGLLTRAKELGTFLTSVTEQNKPVLIIMDKGPKCICAMMGAVYAGCIYTPLDESMPDDRILLIISVLKPEIILTEKKYIEKVRRIAEEILFFDIEEIHCQTDEDKLISIRRN